VIEVELVTVEDCVLLDCVEVEVVLGVVVV
jgi:hypothetical protein